MFKDLNICTLCPKCREESEVVKHFNNESLRFLDTKFRCKHCSYVWLLSDCVTRQRESYSHSVA